MLSVLNIGIHGVKDQDCGMIISQWRQKAAVSRYYMHSPLKQYFIIISELYIVLYQLVLIHHIYVFSWYDWHDVLLWLTGLLLSYILICIVCGVEAIE